MSLPRSPWAGLRRRLLRRLYRNLIAGLKNLSLIGRHTLPTNEGSALQNTFIQTGYCFLPLVAKTDTPHYCDGESAQARWVNLHGHVGNFSAL